MEKQRERFVFLTTTIIILLFSILATNTLLSLYYADKQYTTAAIFVDWLIDEYPDEEQKIMKYIKEFPTETAASRANHLNQYGYSNLTFWKPYWKLIGLSTVICFILFAILNIFTLHISQKSRRSRIRTLTDHLTSINAGKDICVISDAEDDFSPLEDEIYKTVTELRIAKETALIEKQNYADSLANIAHQIKTPVTSLSVMVQMLEGRLHETESEKIKQQIERINQLTDTLLTLSKIDAGILELKQEEVDVYTLISLSIDALESQIRLKEIEVILPNYPDISFTGDLDFSVEAFINLIKNSIDHTPDKGMLYFDYDQNPLYVEISISDSGEGFEEKEIPYIFKRFYQGKISGSSQKWNQKSGTGIGLSISKSIIEMQNGFITAKNGKDGGACFLIRFYCH